MGDSHHFPSGVCVQAAHEGEPHPRESGKDLLDPKKVLKLRDERMVIPPPIPEYVFVRIELPGGSYESGKNLLDPKKVLIDPLPPIPKYSFHSVGVFGNSYERKLRAVAWFEAEAGARAEVMLKADPGYGLGLRPFYRHNSSDNDSDYEVLTDPEDD